MGTDKAYSQNLVDAYDRRHFGGRSGRHIFKRDLMTIQSLLPDTNGPILDIPCGTGIYLAALREQGHTVIGADASWPMLQTTKNRSFGSAGVLCDANHAPFAANTFAGVITLRLLSHFQQDEMLRMLVELRRVIQPGGHIIFDTFRWSPRHWPLFDRLLEKSFMYPIVPDKVEALLKQVGLKKIETRTLYLFSPLWQRKLPFWALQSFTTVEKLLPERWLLRTFWACTKE
jgi:SAM-dependent methyltransferase